LGIFSSGLGRGLGCLEGCVGWLGAELEREACLGDVEERENECDGYGGQTEGS
jgi:hypothetical protein